MSSLCPGPTGPSRPVRASLPVRCILQDFEALTPNLLCRVVETVQGGGMAAWRWKSTGEISWGRLTQLRMLFFLDRHVSY